MLEVRRQLGGDALSPSGRLEFARDVFTYAPTELDQTFGIRSVPLHCPWPKSRPQFIHLLTGPSNACRYGVWPFRKVPSRSSS